MPLGDTIRVIQPGQRRIKIFIDFWNVILSAREQTNFNLSVRWDALADLLVRATRASGHHDESSGALAGCYIFGSFDRSNGPQLREVESIVDEYGPMEGLFFELQERVGKETSSKCSKCGTIAHRSSEAGVDILLTVEMIKHAALREHDYLALVSSDRDFVPLLRYLKDGGQRVIHAAPGSPHREMRNATWKQVALQDAFPSLCRINNEKRVLLYSRHNVDKLEQARKILLDNGRDFDEVDICDKSQISDKDLKFLIQNQSWFLKFRKDDTENDTWVIDRKSPLDNMYSFRKKIFDGFVEDGLPFIMHRGQMEAHGDERWGWMRGSSEGSAAWQHVQTRDASIV